MSFTGASNWAGWGPIRESNGLTEARVVGWREPQSLGSREMSPQGPGTVMHGEEEEGVHRFADGRSQSGVLSIMILGVNQRGRSKEGHEK